MKLAKKIAVATTIILIGLIAAQSYGLFKEVEYLNDIPVVIPQPIRPNIASTTDKIVQEALEKQREAYEAISQEKDTVVANMAAIDAEHKAKMEPETQRLKELNDLLGKLEETGKP